jgi:hypothetical protein
MPKTSTTAFNLICDMEEPLRAVQNFARMIAVFTETMPDSRDACAVQETAWHIIDLAAECEKRRAEAFHFLPRGEPEAPESGASRK